MFCLSWATLFTIIAIHHISSVQSRSVSNKPTILLSSVLQSSQQDDAQMCSLHQPECQCHPDEGNGVWCPSREETHLHMELSDNRLIINCNRSFASAINGTVLLSYAERVQPSDREELIDSITLVGCPLLEAYNELYRALNLTAIRDFKLLGISSHNEMDPVLGPETFKGLERLNSITLEGVIKATGQTHLEPSTLEPMTTLRKLRLVDNGLTELHEDLFADLPNLQLMEIRETHFMTISPIVFNAIPELLELKIAVKDISIINEDMFSNLPKLRYLTLENLTCPIIHKDLFYYNEFLEKINISGSGFQNAPEGTFRHTKLRKFYWHDFDGSMSKNETSWKPQSFLRGLHRLKQVHITASKSSKTIVTFPSDFFFGCSDLRSVKFNELKIESLPQNLFWSNEGLTELYIESSLLKSLPEELLERAVNLKRLTIKESRLVHISNKLLSGLYSLTLLDLSENHVETLDSDCFSSLVNLRKLDLSENRLRFENGSSYIDWKALENIRMIDMAKNQIVDNNITKGWTWMFPNLRVLDLKRNDLGPVLNSANLHFHQRQLFIDLSFNQIEFIQFDRDLPEHSSVKKPDNAWDNQTVSSDNEIQIDDFFPIRRPQIDLRGNPAACDCRADSMLRKVLAQRYSMSEKLKRDPSFDFRVNFDLVTKGLQCNAPNRFHGRGFHNLGLKELQCSFPSPQFLPDTKCPDNCTCTWTVQGLETYVNCSNRGLAQAPNCVPRVENSSSLVVDLSHNKITTVEGGLVRNGDKVTTLRLDHNNITEFKSHHLSMKIKQLQWLTLHNNQLRALDDEVMKLVSKAGNVTLGGNPFECSCSILPVHTIVKEKINHIRDLSNIYVKCGNHSKLLIKYTHEDLCMPLARKMVNTILPIIGFVVSSLAIGVLLTICQRDRVRVIINSHPRLRGFFLRTMPSLVTFLTLNDSLSSKPFDLFISYSEQDSSFVEEELVPNLEQDDDSTNKKLKCLYHKRDFDPGLSILANVCKAVESSSATLMVLSKHFVDSDHCLSEFECARSTRTTKLLAIVCRGLPSDNFLGRDLAKYLRKNTYIKKDDPNLFTKIKLATPKRLDDLEKAQESISQSSNHSQSKNPNSVMH